MANNVHRSFAVQDRSYVALIKKEIHNLTETSSFNKEQVGEIDIIVAEITSNLVKHTSGGELLVRMIEDDRGTGIEIISVDNGPGMNEPLKMVEDGVSTTNTLGHGLGSIKRLSDVFQVYSVKGWGTILLSRKYVKKIAHSTRKVSVEIGAVVIAKPGEDECGDGYSIKNNKDEVTIFLADGLGHGVEAKKAVDKGVEVFSSNNEHSPMDILRIINPEVKKTRGMVGTIASYKHRERKWLLCGIGNISTRLYSAMQSKNYVCYNGIIGMNIPNTMKNQEIVVDHAHWLIMCSDGIKSRWEQQKYQGMMKYDPSVFAAAVYKDYGRNTDDMSVVVIKVS